MSNLALPCLARHLAVSSKSKSRSWHAEVLGHENWMTTELLGQNAGSGVLSDVFDELTRARYWACQRCVGCTNGSERLTQWQCTVLFMRHCAGR
eukprot:scaffold27615_cov90-Phaeocystis_antarctica.AAC.2